MRLALRRTRNPPGSSPSRLRPRSMQERMADQMRATPVSTSFGVRSRISFSRFMAAIDSPLSFAMRSIWAAFANG
jgi:hypothetical protein